MTVTIASRPDDAALHGARPGTLEPRPAVLALQGSVEPHRRALEALGYEPVEVRRPHQLERITHLVMPGGESTTLYKLLDLYRLWAPIRERAQAGSLALFGTCAGAILLGRDATERPPRLGLIDVTVERNAYGRQVDSFVTPIELCEPLGSMEGVFIRAPRLRDPGPGVEVLGCHAGDPILVRQGRCLAATFHPELTDARQLHELFLDL